MIKSVVACLSVASLTLTASAGRNLIWTGQTSSVWNDDPTALNWRIEGDPNNTPVAFESGDNVRFDDTASNQSVTLKQNKIDSETASKQVFQFDVGNCVVSNDTTIYTFDQNSNWGEVWGRTAGDWASFRKQGSGHLDIMFRFEFMCDFFCEGGTVRAVAGSQWSGEFRSCFGSLYDSRSVVFSPGSTAWLNAHYVFGQLGSATPLTLLFDNCTLKASGTTGNMSAGDVYYSNTVFDVANANLYWGNGNVYFRGDTQMRLNGDTALLGQRGGAWLNVYVDDVTGDDQADVIISNKLVDVKFNQSGADYFFRTHFKKYGAGTLELVGSDSTTTGEIQVLEGTLRCNREGLTVDATQTVLGDLTGQYGKRTILVSGPTAGLDMNVNLVKCQCPCDWELRVENGATLGWTDKSTKRNYFGELYLDDAKFVPSEVESFWMDYGAMAVTKKFTLKGKTPYTIAPPNNVNAGKELFFIGFTPADVVAACVNPTSPAGHADFTNLNSRLEISVDDITGSAATDATIGYILCDMRNLTYKTHSDFSPTSQGAWQNNPLMKFANHGGIRKTGAGTLELTKTNQYTLETDVAGGALVVSGSITSSSGVVVRANAYLGGEGTASETTVEANGGFLTRAGQTKGLTLPSLAVQGAVRVKVETDELTNGCRFPLLVLSSKPTSINFDNWSVDCTLPCKTRRFRLCYDAGTGAIDVSYEIPGLSITVR